jgi:serine/threonine protein phosphatase PrpC/serine/threonine protein kinase
MGNASAGTGGGQKRKSAQKMTDLNSLSAAAASEGVAVNGNHTSANGNQSRFTNKTAAKQPEPKLKHPVPLNPKLEAIQTDKEVQKQILAIGTHNPRKTVEGRDIVESETEDGKKFQINYAYFSQTGYYPEDLNKANQDMVSVLAPLPDPTKPANAQPRNVHFFAVFDGHGKTGDHCSEFARDNVPINLVTSEAFQRGDYENAFRESYMQTNSDMHQQEKLGKFSDMMSGTTAISGLVVGRTLYIANVGDSRAIMAVRDESDITKLRAEALSLDQTPFREDERARVKQAGARVLTMDQIEGYRDINEDHFGTEEEDDGDPPRLWCQEGAYPGTAFTRSIGDQVAERIGVYAEPELLRRELSKEDEFLLIASDGVFEFLSSQAVVDIVSAYPDSLEACRAVVAEAYRLWLQYEIRTDDISVILVRFQNLQQQVSGPGRLERTRSTIKELVKAGEVRPVRRNLSRVKQGAVGQMHIDDEKLEGYKLPVYHKSKEECARIKSAVRSNFLFRHLNEEQLDKAVLAMETILVKAKDVIIKQFDEGDRFYIADFGEYDVEVAVPKTKANPDPNGQPIPIEGEFEPPRKVFSYDTKHGNNPCFGELALMYSKPRAATVKAKTDGRLWALERSAFRSILMKTPARRLIQVLKKVEVLKPLTRVDFQRMADLMTEEKFSDGHHIVKQGDTGDMFYIITEGTCVVTRSEVLGVDNPKKVMELTEYGYFGERALLHDLPRAANVICVGTVKVLSIHRRDFEEVVGKIADMVDKDRSMREKKSRRDLLQSDNSLKEEREEFASIASVNDLNGGVFANGSFLAGSGTMRIAQHDGKYVVLKTYGKSSLAQRKEEALVWNELRVTRAINAKSVFLPTLVAAFQSPNCLHLVYNSSVVADLSRYFGKPLPKELIQYLMLGLSNAFDFLHGALQLIYRGLVPEAVGLDKRGVVQLCDFRFSKSLLDDTKTFTICGTPEYMSPEQVAGIGHGFEADWWSLGILAYEALVGMTPWGGDGKNEIGIYSSISSFTNHSLTFPHHTDKGAKEFVHALLRENVDERIKSATEVGNHPFIKSVANKLQGHNPFESQLSEAFATVLTGARVDPESLDSIEEAFAGGETFDDWKLEAPRE